MFTDKEIIALKNFTQKIIESPYPINEERQWVKRNNGHIWCEDWETIEILKYLFNGREMYYGDPPPNRLKNNPLWSKDEIAKRGEQLIEQFDNVVNGRPHYIIHRENRDIGMFIYQLAKERNGSS